MNIPYEKIIAYITKEITSLIIYNIVENNITHCNIQIYTNDYNKLITNTKNLQSLFPKIKINIQKGININNISEIHLQIDATKENTILLNTILNIYIP